MREGEFVLARDVPVVAGNTVPEELTDWLRRHEKPQVLLVHAGRYGQAERIGARLAQQLFGLGIEPTLMDVGDTSVNVGSFHIVCLIASVKFGRFRPDVRNFIEINADSLASAMTALVTVSLLARHKRAGSIDSNPYTEKLKFLAARNGWVPDIVESAAGALRYQRLSIFDRALIRAFMRAASREIAAGIDAEYTDWLRIDRIPRELILRHAQQIELALEVSKPTR